MKAGYVLLGAALFLLGFWTLCGFPIGLIVLLYGLLAKEDSR